MKKFTTSAYGAEKENHVNRYSHSEMKPKRRFSGLRLIALTACLLTATAGMAQEEENVNWADSVKVARTLARQGVRFAYIKLADYYHLGRGVEHNPVMMGVMLEKVEDLRLVYLAMLPDDDADKLLVEKNDGESVLEAIAQAAKNDEPWALKVLLVRTYIKDKQTERLLELAEQFPALYAEAGDMFYDDGLKEKAIDCYRKADEWACLKAYQAWRLCRYYNENLARLKKTFPEEE